MSMKLKLVLTAALGMACALLLVPAVIYAQDAASAPKPIVPSDELMDLFADPMHEALKAALMDAPTTKKGWRAIRDQANVSAEIANLVLLRDGEEERTPEWKQFSTAMQQASLALADATKSENFPDVQAKYLALIESCNACHKKFAEEDSLVEP